MFREMRRKERELSKFEAIELLKKCEYGVLSTVGQDGYAYGVPLNYVYMDECIYFHCVVEGHKLDNIKGNDKVSFCSVGQTEPIPENFSTRYESVVVFGTAVEVYGNEKYNALLAILEKYANQYMESGKELIKKADSSTKVIKLCIEHISGKARR